MPPLREMAGDIPPIVEAVMRRLAEQAGLETVPALSADAMEALRRHPFPGNVRELENILERALALSSGGAIGPEDLNLPAPSGEFVPPAAEAPDQAYSLPDYLDQVERAAILSALEKTRYNKTAAAKLLGISFRALRYRLERLGLD